MSELVYSAIRTPDGTVLRSTHRHDYVSHVDKNGEMYMLDGGLDYVRTSLNKEPAEDLSLTINDSHEKIREVVTWGTYGKSGKDPIKFIAVKEMSDKHIEAVYTLPNMHPIMFLVLTNEMEYRDRYKISVAD